MASGRRIRQCLRGPTSDFARLLRARRVNNRGPERRRGQMVSAFRVPVAALAAAYVTALPM